MLCERNSRRATGNPTEHSWCAGSAPCGAQGEGMGAMDPKPSQEQFQGCRRLWQTRSHLPIQPEQCLCCLLCPPILSQQSQISPDKAHYRQKEAMRGTKKYWFQPREKIKVNLLTADNINLPESKCSPSMRSSTPSSTTTTHPGSGDIKWPSVSRGQLN